MKILNEWLIWGRNPSFLLHAENTKSRTWKIRKQVASILKSSPQYSRAAFKKMSLNATPLLEISRHSLVSYIRSTPTYFSSFVGTMPISYSTMNLTKSTLCPSPEQLLSGPCSYCINSQHLDVLTFGVISI